MQPHRFDSISKSIAAGSAGGLIPRLLARLRSHGDVEVPVVSAFVDHVSVTYPTTTGTPGPNDPPPPTAGQPCQRDQDCDVPDQACNEYRCRNGVCDSSWIIVDCVDFGICCKEDGKVQCHCGDECGVYCSGSNEICIKPDFPHGGGWFCGCQAGFYRCNGVCITGSCTDTNYPVDPEEDALGNYASIKNPERGIYYWQPVAAGGRTYHTIVAEWLYLGNACADQLVWNGHNALGTSDILNKYADTLAMYRPPCGPTSTSRCGKKVLFRPRYDADSEHPGLPPGCTTFHAYSSLGIEQQKDLQLNHIDAIAAMLGEFKDVVAFIEAGYFGMWGEWNREGGATSVPLLDSVSHRAEIVDHMLLRYEQAGLTQQVGFRRPVWAKEVRDRNPNARVGIYDDCFMTDEFDQGTYDNYDATCTNTPGENCNLANFPTEAAALAWAEQESIDFSFGGETCPVPNITERWRSCDNMVRPHTWPRRLRTSYLHPTNPVAARDAWITQGCYDEIRRKLGYRFEVRRVEYTRVVSSGQSFQVRVVLANTGWSRLHKPRKAFLVLRRDSMPSEIYEDPSPAGNVTSWAPGGTTTLTFTGVAPARGTYDVRLWIPDPDDPVNPTQDPDAQGQVEYAVKLATLRNGANIFDSSTGDNRLGIEIIVRPESTNSGDGPIFDEVWPATQLLTAD